MKIEKISEMQVRCTLTRTDLTKRGLRVSELAYGTPKARMLFDEMLIAASEEVGFEVEDYPVMMEAIPISNECIVIVISKVENPEELDARFANFTPTLEDDDDFYDETELFDDSDIFPALPAPSFLFDEDDDEFPFEPHFHPIPTITERRSARLNRYFHAAPDLAVFTFDSMRHVITMAHAVKNDIGEYQNSLYKDNSTNRYVLVVHRGRGDEINFISLCNMISEYGKNEGDRLGTEHYINEHFSPIIANDAISDLGKV